MAGSAFLDFIVSCWTPASRIPTWGYWAAAVYGALFGSFANVCILRLPLEESVVKPRSRCPKCRTVIAWYDNLPILSWIVLRGRCRTCKAPISARYWVIEGLTALLAVLFLWRFGFYWTGIIYFLLALALLIVAVIDMDHRIIPNVISLPGIVIGFLLSFVLPSITPLDSFLGILIGGGSLFAVAEIYRLIRKQEGMGMGDVKLLAMIGAFLGWKPLLFVLLISSATGAVAGVTVIAWKGEDMKYQIPFGTFLSFAAILYMLQGPEIFRFWMVTSARLMQ